MRAVPGWPGATDRSDREERARWAQVRWNSLRNDCWRPELERKKWKRRSVPQKRLTLRKCELRVSSFVTFQKCDFPGRFFPNVADVMCSGRISPDFPRTYSFGNHQSYQGQSVERVRWARMGPFCSPAAQTCGQREMGMPGRPPRPESAGPGPFGLKLMIGELPVGRGGPVHS